MRRSGASSTRPESIAPGGFVETNREKVAAPANFQQLGSFFRSDAGNPLADRGEGEAEIAIADQR